MNEIVLNLGPRPVEELRLMTANNFKQLPLVDGETYGGVFWKGNHCAIISKVSQFGPKGRWTATVGIAKIEDGFKDYIPMLALGEIDRLEEGKEPYIFSESFIENGLKQVMKVAAVKEQRLQEDLGLCVFRLLEVL